MFLKNCGDMPSCFECSVFKYVAKCDGFIYPLSIISKHGSKLRRVTLQIMGVNAYFKQFLPIFCFYQLLIRSDWMATVFFYNMSGWYNSLQEGKYSPTTFWLLILKFQYYFQHMASLKPLVYFVRIILKSINSFVSIMVYLNILKMNKWKPQSATSLSS